MLGPFRDLRFFWLYQLCRVLTKTMSLYRISQNVTQTITSNQSRNICRRVTQTHTPTTNTKGKFGANPWTSKQAISRYHKRLVPHLGPETSINKQLFQLDDEPNLYMKTVLFHKTSIKQLVVSSSRHVFIHLFLAIIAISPPSAVFVGAFKKAPCHHPTDAGMF